MMTNCENRSLFRDAYVTLVVVVTHFIVTVTMMTSGELKQLNEKLLKQIQGENFSVLWFGFVLLCNKENFV